MSHNESNMGSMKETGSDNSRFSSSWHASTSKALGVILEVIIESKKDPLEEHAEDKLPRREDLVGWIG